MAVFSRPRPDSKQYAYDKDNRLTKATEGTVSANYTYDSFSRMTGLTAKNGSTSVVSTAVTYVDPSSSATSTQVKTWNNGKAAYTYTYDSKGNITSISDGSKTVTYAYDAFGRLVDVYDPISQQHCVYTYDNGGNLLQKEIYKPKKSSGGSGGGGGGGTIIISPVEPPAELMSATQPDEHGYYLSEQIGYTYGDATWKDLLTAFNGKSITYDAIGNPLSDGTWTYAWQHGRQLASMSKSGSSITYGYNADGKRISKTVNGTTYNYAYLGDTLTDLSWGSNRMHFTYDSLGPASVTYNGVKYFYLKNAQGDVTGLVNASGTQVVSYAYDPWGAPMSTDGTMASTLGAANPLRYRGYVYDTETGLYYLSSRYYNPTWGRFINADDVSFLGVDGPLAGNNLFAYCNDNPVRYTDKTGYAFGVDDLIAAAVGAIVSVASQAVSDIIATAFGGGKFSSLETYVGAALGGAIGGVASLYVGPHAGSAISAGMSTLIGQSLENITGTESRETTEIIMNSMIDFTMAGVLSKATPIKVSGITAGRNSMSAVYSSGLTKLANKTARRMSLNVFGKGITAGLTASVHITIFVAVKMRL